MFGWPRRPSGQVPGDPVASAIFEWWDEMEGPHHQPLYLNIEKAAKLAEHLRKLGYIKEPKK